ncbi:MAG: TPR end-of-group domain-containing protein [Planctomycetota bacterium]
MLLSISLILLQSPPPAPAAAAPVVQKGERQSAVIARLPGSFVHIRLEIPGFTEDDRNAKILKNLLGERAVIAGAIPAAFTSFEVMADREKDSKLTNEQWRDQNLEGSGSRWKEFDAAGMACGEHTAMIDGSGSHDLHAFAVLGGYRIDVHAGESLTATRKAAFTREEFTRILETLRLAVVRRGAWHQMPDEALDLMNSALRRADWRAWMDELAKKTPDDYAIPFATAELLRHEEAPPAEPIPYYTRAIELLAAKKGATAKETLAYATCEDGLALALLDSNEPAKAIPHLEKGLAIAGDLTAPVRGGIAYNLACAHARLGHEDEAVARLLESEGWAPGALQRAKIDKDFDSIRKSVKFQRALVGNPDKN